MDRDDYLKKYFPAVLTAITQNEKYPPESFFPGMMLISLQAGFSGRAGILLKVVENKGDCVELTHAFGLRTRSLLHFNAAAHWTTKVYVLEEGDLEAIEGSFVESSKWWLEKFGVHDADGLGGLVIYSKEVSSNKPQ